MVSSRLKERFEDAIASAVKPLGGLGVTPNMVTAAGLLASIISAWCYYDWRRAGFLLPAAGGLLLLSGLLDAVDGVLARTSGKTTKFGGFLDSVSDRYADVIVLSGVILGGLCDTAVGLAALTGFLMVSYARSRAEAAGVAMAGVGLAERAERLVILAAATFLTVFKLDALNWGVALLAALTHLTVLQRMLHFRRKTLENQ
jgi:archaetidylinositol phosphate synthase